LEALVTSVVVDPRCSDDERDNYYAWNRDSTAIATSRISVDFRVVRRADGETGRGAGSVDSHCTRTAMRDYLRVSHLERLPAEVVAIDDANVPGQPLQYAIYSS
jgi:hypothetical protein